MKKVVISILLMYSFTQVEAQKADTLTAAKRQCTTVEELLGLPSIYTVLECTLVASQPPYIARLPLQFAKTDTQDGEQVSKIDFGKVWTTTLSHAHKGDKITIADIKIKRGDKEMKLMDKTFIIP